MSIHIVREGAAIKRLRVCDACRKVLSTSDGFPYDHPGTCLSVYTECGTCHEKTKQTNQAINYVLTGEITW